MGFCVAQDRPRTYRFEPKALKSLILSLSSSALFHVSFAPFHVYWILVDCSHWKVESVSQVNQPSRIWPCWSWTRFCPQFVHLRITRWGSSLSWLPWSCSPWSPYIQIYFRSIGAQSCSVWFPTSSLPSPSFSACPVSQGDVLQEGHLIYIFPFSRFAIHIVHMAFSFNCPLHWLNLISQDPDPMVGEILPGGDALKFTQVTSFSEENNKSLDFFSGPYKSVE